MSKVESKEQFNFAAMLDESLQTASSLDSKVVVGTIVGINGDKVVVDVGLKSEGRLLLNDVIALKGTSDVKIGDTLSVYVEKFEDKNGSLILSIERAKKEAVWSELDKHFADKTTISCVVMTRSKGGFLVDIRGTQAFLPGSQVDMRSLKDQSAIVGSTFQVKIIKMDKARNNIVVSRRLANEESQLELRKNVLESLVEGEIRTGIVKNTTEYGAFVDLGGIDGLVHVTDIAWRRVASPADVLKINEEVKVIVLKVNKESGRISLGIKQLTDSPWSGIEDRYAVGSVYPGTIVNTTEYGAFVELEPCIEGMAYLSELVWGRKNVIPSKVFSVGMKVNALVLEVNASKRKIALGLKQCTPNPWKEFADKNPINSVIKGTVSSITEFGIFITVGDIDGMVHLSDVSWDSEHQESKSLPYQKGQELEVVVLDVNIEKERINLGIKQLHHDPLKDAFTINRGDTVTATVSGCNAAGIDVTLENGLPGFVKKMDLSIDKFLQKTENFTVGDKIEAVVLTVDKQARKANLSIKALESKLENEALKNYGSSSDNGACLGDLLDDAMKDKLT
ncbi:30S ribosomal protein S1 [Alphaproteobacteria bacterium]|nr:30S ribosomal protein S1 [Alphaproteobacteria bacterium]